MKINTTKSKLLSSLLILVLCVTAFAGSTYAWFTDSVTSAGNIIKAGNLDATLEYHNGTTWVDASTGAIFDYDKWEPGYTAIKKVKIGNAGNLAFQFMLNIIPSSTPATGEANLADVIDVYMFSAGETVTRETVKGATPVGTLTQLMADGDGAAHGVLYPEGAANTPAGAPVKEVEVTIALKMQESAGNEYMNASVGGGFKVQLLATQLAYEGDSFGPNYDIDADYTPDYGIFKEVTAKATKKAGEDTVMAASGVKATVPAAAAVVDANAEMVLTVTPSPKTVPDGFTVTEDQAILNYEIKMENLATGNTAPIAVELQLAKGLENVELYHNGVKIASNYNAETGILSFATTSFSPFTVVYGKNTIDVEENLPLDPTDKNTILIGTAAELAGFAKAVNDGDNFKGKTVKLTADIDLRNADWTPIGFEGKPFKGNFDGQNHTISNLKIYDREASSLGLFGVADGAKIENVKVNNVDITGYAEVAAIVGGSEYETYAISNCHVTGKINLVAEYAYVGGISGGQSYVTIDNCSVIADGIGVLASNEKNAVGGISAWMLENASSITNCQVKNLDLTGWANVGSITGFVHYNNTIENCKAENISLTKTRLGGNETIGVLAGGWSYGAGKTITLKDNTLNNITMNAISGHKGGVGELYGGEYATGKGKDVDTSIIVTTGNKVTNVIDNRVIATVASNAATLKAAIAAGESVVLGADIDLGSDQITVPTDAEVTLNLNGYDIKADYSSATTAPSAMFYVNKGAALTIKGNGDVHAVAAPTLDYVSAIINNIGGDVVIDGGSYSMTYGSYADGYLIPTIIDTNSNIGKATTTINGGTFSHTRNMFRNFAQPQRGTNNATLIINGGTFNGQADDEAAIWNQKTSASGVDGDGVVVINGGTFNYVYVDNEFGESAVTIANGINIKVV